MIKILNLTFFVLAFVILTQNAYPYDVKPLKAFSPEDRILILAPHPDDEAIGAGGIIQEAKRLKIPLKIIYLTNGDNNEPSFIINQKRFVIRQKAVLQMGELRAQEAINAGAFLGIRREDQIFLGYPDWGTEDIFTSFWREQKPYKTWLTRVKAVPYKDAFSVGSPYVGDSILKDLKKIIKDFKPTKIFVSHPFDLNRDHRAFYLFLQIALWDLEGKISQPEVYAYLIHWQNWPTPRGYKLRLSLVPPKQLTSDGEGWTSFLLKEGDMERKRKAIYFYKTQISYNPPFLFTFARRNELFAENSFINLPANNVEITPSEFGTISYSRDDKFFVIKFKWDSKIEKPDQARIFLLGYSKDVHFANLPKVRLNIDFKDKKISASEQRSTINIPDAVMEERLKQQEMVIRIPLHILGDPDYVMTSTSISNAPFEWGSGGWRILRFK
jgi:LmbE family N-acetylglucosaminyl deacetylase